MAFPQRINAVNSLTFLMMLNKTKILGLKSVRISRPTRCVSCFSFQPETVPEQHLLFFIAALAPLPN